MEEDQILPLFTSPVISCPEHLDPSLKLRSLELQDYGEGMRTPLYAWPFINLDEG